MNSLRKRRDDSTWNRLTPEQLEVMEGWLFDENLGYQETLERVKNEFGLDTTVASLGRYYRRCARDRQANEMLLARETANELNNLGVDVEELRAAAMKLVAKAVLKLATEKPDDLDHLASLAKILLDSEQNDIRRKRLKLAEKYFDFESIMETQKDMPRLIASLASIGDDADLSHDEKIKKVQNLLFGWRNGHASNNQPEPEVRH